MMGGDDKRANGRQIEPRTGGKNEKANTKNVVPKKVYLSTVNGREMME